MSLGGTDPEPRRTGSLIHTCLLPGCGCQPPPPPLNVVAVQCSGTRPPSHCKPRQVRRPPPQWWPACATASAPYARRRCRSRRLPFSSSLGAPCPLAAKLSSSSSRSQHPLLLLNLAAAPPPLPPPQTVEHGGARAAAAGNCAASGRQPDYQLLIRPRQLGDGAALLARWTARATAVQHVLRAAASPCTVCQAIEPLHNDPPIARSNGTKGVGLAMSFARELLASGRVQRVGFIPCAFGGAPLSRWVKQPATAGDAFTGRAAEIAANPGAAGDLYDRAARRLRLGLQLAGAEAAGAEVVFAGVLWHQGESDTHELALAESVQARLVTVIDALRAEAPAGCTVDPSPHSTQPPCAHHGSVRAPWPDRTVVAPPDALAEHRCHSSSANSVPPPRPPKKNVLALSMGDLQAWPGPASAARLAGLFTFHCHHVSSHLPCIPAIFCTAERRALPDPGSGSAQGSSHQRRALRPPRPHGPGGAGGGGGGGGYGWAGQRRGAGAWRRLAAFRRAGSRSAAPAEACESMVASCPTVLEHNSMMVMIVVCAEEFGRRYAKSWLSVASDQTWPGKSA